MYPEVDEQAEVAFAILCPSLDAIVHIKHRELIEKGPVVEFECPCGHQITRPRHPDPVRR